jgi:hypothetical protein
MIARMVAAAPDYAALLARHRPVLRYDSQEPYFADSAAEWTDNPGNELCRMDGSLIASAGPGQALQQLSLSFLAAGSYADGSPVSHFDRIRDPAHDYVAQARLLHVQTRYANRIYGHWATGDDGRVWLAYWFFYFYNDYNLLGDLLPAGLHEGDWEMIQLRLEADNAEPDLAVYAQHTAAESRPWGQVEKVGERPVVYPARGSHASYFHAGIHWTGHWFDHADGRRGGRDCTLELIGAGDPAYRWATWPGMWGGTEPKPGLDRPLEDSSPRGPGGHAQWRDPSELHFKAQELSQLRAQAPPSASTLPAAPVIDLLRDGSSLRIDYSTPDSDLAQLIVTVNSPQDPMPPALYREPISGARGRVLVAAELKPAWSYDVHVSTATSDGRASPSAESLLAAG